jgi:hypothetical protein
MKKFFSYEFVQITFLAVLFLVVESLGLWLVTLTNTASVFTAVLVSLIASVGSVFVHYRLFYKK